MEPVHRPQKAAGAREAKIHAEAGVQAPQGLVSEGGEAGTPSKSPPKVTAQLACPP